MAEADGHMNQSAILDPSWIMPGFLATGLAKSLCTIKQPANISGEPTIDPPGTPPGTYSDIPGLVGIQCMDAPETEGDISATEVKALSETASIEVRHVLLGGYFPQLDTSENWGDIGWRAVVTNPFGVPTTYDILGCEADSQRTQIRLKLRLVTL